MKIISSKLHGLLDYGVALILIASPWIVGFANDGAQTFVPVVLGAVTIVYSLLTKYEVGLAGVIPFPTHLILDTISGILLLASPWLFGFSDQVYVPHVVFGMLELGVVLFTDKTVRTK